MSSYLFWSIEIEFSYQDWLSLSAWISFCHKQLFLLDTHFAAYQRFDPKCGCFRGILNTADATTALSDLCLEQREFEPVDAGGFHYIVSHLHNWILQTNFTFENRFLGASLQLLTTFPVHRPSGFEFVVVIHFCLLDLDCLKYTQFLSSPLEVCNLHALLGWTWSRLDISETLRSFTDLLIFAIELFVV